MNFKNIFFALLYSTGVVFARPFNYEQCKARFESVDQQRVTMHVPAEQLKELFDQWSEAAYALAVRAPNPGAQRNFLRKIIEVLHPELGRQHISQRAQAIFKDAQSQLAQ